MILVQAALAHRVGLWYWVTGIGYGQCKTTWIKHYLAFWEGRDRLREDMPRSMIDICELEQDFFGAHLSEAANLISKHM